MSQIEWWGDQLLAYFFGSAADPVLYVAATPGSLRLATGARFATDQEAHQHFVEIFQAAVGRQLFSQAIDDELATWNRNATIEPTSLAVLLVGSCLAAHDMSTVEGHAYTRSLTRLISNGREHEAGNLAGAWIEFAAWLRRRREDGEPYASLTLPPERVGWKHVGYALDLTFPRDHDLALLADLLESEGYVGEPPSPPAVLGIFNRRGVAAFSDRFRDALASFREDHSIGVDRANHPFLRAVEIASRRPRTNDGLGAFSFVAALDGQQLRPYLVATSEAAARRSGFDHRRWGDRILLCQGDNFIEPVFQVLSGAKQLSGLAPFRRGGLLPFNGPLGAIYEACRGRTVSAAHHFLIDAARSTDLLRALCARPGGMRTAPALIPGWTQVLNAKVTSPKDLPEELTPGARGVYAASISFEGGIPIQDGYLAVPQLLPMVRCFGAEEATISGGSKPLERIPDDDGAFALPPSLAAATYEVQASASVPGFPAKRTLHLFAPGEYAEFKVPSGASKDVLFGEGGLSDEVKLADALTFAVADDVEHLGTSWGASSGVLWLGRVAGQLASTPRDGFDWQLETTNDGRRVVYRLGSVSSDMPPEDARVRDDGDHRGNLRLWRQAFKGELGPVVGPQALRELYRARAINVPVALRAVPSEYLTKPRLHEFLEVGGRVQQACDVLATIASRTQGVPAGRFFETLDAVLELGSLDTASKAAVARAWQEVGCVDLWWDATWRGMTVTFRPPRALIFRAGADLRCVITGLVSSRLRRQLTEAFERAGMELREKGSVSPHVPAQLVVHGTDFSSVITALDSCSLTTRCALPPLRETVATVANTIAAPRLPLSTAETTRYWSPSIAAFVEAQPADDVILTELSSVNTPKRYQISRSGQPVWWSASKVWGFLAFHLLRGREPFRSEDFGIRRVDSSPTFLPLPLARTVAALGPASPGPEGSGRTLTYLYPAMTSSLRRDVLDALGPFAMAVST
ncbi:MAG: hypothetical protein IT383_10540 [Deltaproteobacteria bacterium]|nr:hypothetical protein [Deltaproteobacteria bacterium]